MNTCTHSQRHPGPRPRPRPTALSLALTLAFAPAWAAAQTLPTQPSVVHGSATITRPGVGQMNVQQISQNAIINWQAFSVGPGGRVVFNQPNAQSVALNRVTGSDPSTVLGSLVANGRIFLVNPNGVLFGAGASVNVGGLVASTLSISDADFAAGRYGFTRAGATPASAVNEGSLQAAPGGVIALVGSTVRNSGVISAPQGTAALAAGKTVTLDLQGDGLTQLRITEADLQALSANSGTLAADGGRVLMLADATQATGFVVNQSGIVRARSLASRNGAIVLDGGAGDVNVAGTLDATGGGRLSGGGIDISGRNVGVLTGGTRIDASGNSGGGTIQLTAARQGAEGGVIAVAAGTELLANALASGAGGAIRTDSTGLRLHGSAQARGGSAGGDGGRMKITATSGVDLEGARVDFSAANGRAGTWDIDPYNISVVTVAPRGTVTLGAPFTATTDSYVLASDISAALNSGSNVTLSTGIGGPAANGFISIASGVAITRSSGAAALTLRFDANKAISMVGASITSVAGPLNVDFNADANSPVGSATPVGGGRSAIFLNSSTITTAGGSVRFFGQSDPINGAAPNVGFGGVSVTVSSLDTRGAGGDGALVARGTASGNLLGDAAVRVAETDIKTGAGSVSIDGRVTSGSGDGVNLGAADLPLSLATTSGAIDITGIGLQNATSTAAAGIRLISSAITPAAVRTATGAITFAGRATGVLTSNAEAASGVRIQADTQVVATAPGAAPVLITGEAGGAGYGVYFEPTIGAAPGGQVLTTGRNVVIRAGNDGTVDAVSLYGGFDAASVRQSSIVANGAIVNLRPGRVSAAGVASDDVAAPISVAAGSGGFDLSSSDLLSITGASSVVIGSDAHAGAITAGFLTRDGNLTLQAGTGNITIDRAVLDVGPTSTLGLLTAGQVQAVSGINNGVFFDAGVRAATLVVQAGGAGGASITDLIANRVGTLAADTGASPLAYEQAPALVIGTGRAAGFSAASQSSTAITIDGVRTGVGLVRTGGALTLTRDVSGATLDLVTATTLDNAAARAITAANRWRVWADTWVGEMRGGLAGNGLLPNIYGCSYGVACAIVPAAGADSFIYVQRPNLAVTVNNQTRRYGDANPAFTLNAVGLINGDLLGNAVAGTPSTAAAATANVGSYPIIGSALSSPAGYRLIVNDGLLAVTPRPLTLVADNASRVYGDANPLLTGSASGLASFDTAASVGLAFGTVAAVNSNVGSYAITPALSNAALAANYAVTSTNGVLAVSPATLTYVADAVIRTNQQPNPVFTGTVAGFKAADTLASATTGSLAWVTSATASAEPGTYAINGGGLSATNYTLQQALGNATALTITGASSREKALALMSHELGASAVEPRRDEKSTYVYDRNLGLPQLCVPDSPLDSDASRRAATDLLAVEWSRLRSRPNVTACFDSGRRNDCSDF